MRLGVQAIRRPPPCERIARSLGIGLEVNCAIYCEDPSCYELYREVYCKQSVNSDPRLV